MSADLVDRDSEHLALLSILHYAAAGVTALMACFPLIHVAVLMFMGMGLAAVSVGWTLAAAHFLTAKFLKQKRRHTSCVAASLVTCVACTFSSGIVSIATLVVLFRPGVRDIFDSANALQQAG